MFVVLYLLSMNTSRLILIEQMLKKNPNDDFLLYAAALEHHKTGSLEKAIELLSRLRDRSPDYLGTYYQLGSYFEQLGDDDRAVEAYQAGIPVARSQGDIKTIGELTEALMLLDAEYE